MVAFPSPDCFHHLKRLSQMVLSMAKAVSYCFYCFSQPLPSRHHQPRYNATTPPPPPDCFRHLKILFLMVLSMAKAVSVGFYCFSQPPRLTSTTSPSSSPHPTQLETFLYFKKSARRQLKAPDAVRNYFLFLEKRP